jgi:NF-X1-type zinc finger protein NFXL1
MKSKDKIWSCSKCYCPFHLLCIQKWANDSTIQKKLFHDNQPQGYYTNTGEYVTKKQIPINWDCPQCRVTYELSEIPRNYYCYCGKERDPEVQSFILPHSCGEICNKQLIGCNHKCRLLCHPRACPSCPVVIQTSCLCKKSPLKSIRCSQGWWVCAQKCQKQLPCGHKCEENCHDECPPCPKSSNFSCACKKKSKVIKCAESKWFCENHCGKLYSCQKHKCEETCHSGSCGECPYRSNQSCFCGKQTYTSSDCDKLVRESCGNTCFKLLACGLHKCMERCHKGDCGNCLEKIKKKCRCGTIEKDSPCSKELLCETKCKNIKNCKKHNCNRKCCIECLPCDKICGKSLKCGKHKCGALCHDGECYPCNEKSIIKCRCNFTKILVKCGKKNVKTPNCKQPCKFNTKKCHHDPIPHKCHPNECPVCIQICNEILPCKHKCAAKCHDNVKTITKDKNYVPKMPGEFAEVKVEILKLEHPPCKIPVNFMCLGGHVNNEFQCYEAKVMSCGRKCGKELKCGNHKCQLDCHAMKGLKCSIEILFIFL